ncbi:hypothetical protein [Cellulosimicrobium sp. Marseille-Q4280]|uniref:hypothetical protein n=1 Tax=Cellulosimicrobium sp. Marseille-Q4280 TaxID=2937992 RepID=UPI00203EE5C6|nr:hypothetical protein [Cellulosimicrobium sp. Marseille-Q4280]
MSGPTANLVRRTETIEVAARVELGGFPDLSLLRGDSPLILTHATVTATEHDGHASCRVHVVGTNHWNVQQTGTFTAPRGTDTDPNDAYNARVGHVSDLPADLRAALEAATGIRFADYGVA